MNNNPYTLGLVSISFRKNSPEEILRAAREAGLSCIEWGSDVHAPCADLARLHEIADLQKAYGIRCCSYGTYFRLGETPIEQLPQYIAAAKILGTDILRLWCGSTCGDSLSEEETKALIEQCKIAAQIAQQEGVTLCMECHKGTYTQRLEDALALMNAVASPHFRMYWQPFQWQTVSGNLEYAEKIAPFTRHIHVFQWKEKLRFPLAEGIQEWRSYLRQFSGSRTLLLEFMPDDRIESLKSEAIALKTIAGVIT